MKKIEDQVIGLSSTIKDNAIRQAMSAINAVILGDSSQLKVDPQTEISHLCDLHEFINSEKNLAYFTQIKQRKTVEEINLTIISRINEIILKKYNLQQYQNLEMNNVEVSKLKKGLFFFIIALGTFFAAANAISLLQGVITTFTALASIPNVILLPIEIACALLGVVAFYGFELRMIGKPLGIRAFETGQVFKLYAQQAQKYQECFNTLNRALVKDISESDLGFLKDTSDKLNATYENFGKKVNEVKEALAKPPIGKTILRRGFTIVAATIFGIIGMTAGPSFVSTLIFPLLTVAAATGPIGLGITIGTCLVFFAITASLYLLIETSAVDKLVDRFAGTPTKSMNQIIKAHTEIEETKNLITGLLKKNEDLIKDKPKTKRIHRAQPNQLGAWQKQKTETQNQQHPENRFGLGMETSKDDKPSEYPTTKNHQEITLKV